MNSITLTFIGGGVNDIPMGINNPAWYLCVLLICYIFVYFLLWISKKLNVSSEYAWFFMVVLGISVSTYKLNMPFLNNATGRGYASFFVGMILYKIFMKIPQKNLFIISSITLFITAITVLFKLQIGNQQGIFTFIIWPCVIFLFLSCEPLFKWKVFTVTGSSSFEMYLFHVAGIYIYMSIKHFFGNTYYTFYEMIGFAFVIMCCSIIINRFVELPITKNLKKYIPA